MAKFRIDGSSEVREIEVLSDRGEDVTNDFVAMYEWEHGDVARRLGANDADEAGYGYVVDGAEFECMLAEFEAMCGDQDGVLHPVSVWSDWSGNSRK